MPCFYTGSAEGDAELEAKESRKALTAATRAACEMAKALDGDFVNLSPATKQWIIKHMQVDELPEDGE